MSNLINELNGLWLSTCSWVLTREPNPRPTRLIALWSTNETRIQLGNSGSDPDWDWVGFSNPINKQVRFEPGLRHKCAYFLQFIPSMAQISLHQWPTGSWRWILPSPPIRPNSCVHCSKSAQINLIQSALQIINMQTRTIFSPGKIEVENWSRDVSESTDQQHFD